MKKMKRRTQRNILLGICVLAVIFLIVLLIRGIGRLTAGHADTSEGIGYIKNAEDEDITVIEEKISRLEEQDGEAGGERSLKERFSQAVVLGDAAALGFSEYNILNASSVAAEAGAHLDQADSLIQKTKELSPQIIFVSLGSSDVNDTNGDTARFTELYGDFLETLQTEIPDAHIFVNSVFPAQEKDPVRNQLAGSLRAVLSQKLEVDKQEGRVALFELLINTPAVGNLIREGKTHQLPHVIQTGQQVGMITFQQSYQQRVKEGRL